MSHTPDPIVTQLTRARYDQSLTQRATAARIHSPAIRTSIAAWESGRRSPMLATLRAWARALGYDLVLQPIGETRPREATP